MRAGRILRNPQQAKQAMDSLYVEFKPYLLAGHEFSVSVKPKTRSLEQNSRLWAMLTDVSRQVVWHGRKLSPEEWKHVFTAGLKRQDVVPGLDGGFVVLGQSTSQMSVREMGDLMELISAFGSQRGVRFTAPEYEDAV